MLSLGLSVAVARWRVGNTEVTLAMLAHAFLVVAAVTERTQRPPPSGLIPLTCNEIQHLFAALVAGSSSSPCVRSSEPTCAATPTRPTWSLVTRPSPSDHGQAT